MTTNTWPMLAATVGICLVLPASALAAPAGTKAKTQSETTQPSSEESEAPKPELPKPEPSRPESLATGAPPDPSDVPSGAAKLAIRPYVLMSGGVKYDTVYDLPEEDKQNRVSTFALARFGLKATFSDWVYVESELMASGGIGLHGASAYEGQAALQVRQQMIRLGRGFWRVEVGRFIDEASVDFFSAHVGETFLQDTATRDPLLFSGFNLGNGVRASAEVLPGLRFAFTVNASNPVSTTSSLMVGGTYPPFERFYTQPYQSINQGANHFPDDSFHMVVLTPSVLYDSKLLDAHVAVQRIDVDTDMSRSSNAHVTGFNTRGTVRVKLLDRMLIPFASTAYTQNDTLDPANLARRSDDRYQAVNFGGGVDVNWARRFECAHDCADGVGIQYQQAQYQIGEGLVTTNRYANVGITTWLAPYVSLGARFAVWQSHPQFAAMTGERSGIVALRFVMQ